MFRLFLITLAVCHAVFAFPQESDTKEKLSGDLELLQRTLKRFLQDETEPENKAVDIKRFGWHPFIPTIPSSPAITLVDIVNPQTEQSSTLTFRGVKYVSGKAVDKNFNSDLINGGTCAHTETQNNPWWKVSLPESHCIAQVGIVNRRDGDSDRLTGAMVRVGGLGGPTCGSPVTSESANIPGGMNMVICDPPIMADKIIVHIPRDGATLQICEVQMWEVPKERCR